MKRIILLFSCSLILSTSILAQDTTFDDLKLIMAREATIIKEEGNMIHYKVDELQLFLIVDENANRMRLMSPVVEESKLTDDDLKLLMESNFDRALDAKYAISNGILWSVFAHPLKELYKDQMVDAFNQVRNLVYTYGTTYTSTTMVFGGDGN